MLKRACKPATQLSLGVRPKRQMNRIFVTTFVLAVMMVAPELPCAIEAIEYRINTNHAGLGRQSPAHPTVGRFEVEESSIAGLVAPSVADMPETSERSIYISPEGPLVFGRRVSLRVRYSNGEGGYWVIQNPAESLSVILRHLPSGSDKRPQGYSLGRVRLVTAIRSDGYEMTAEELPSPEPISIGPGQVYEFSIFFVRDWSTEVLPGLWTVWIDDRALKIESNRIEIQSIFTSDSIAACYEIASDSEQNVFKRRWHARWLQKIIPDLDLKWWSYDTPPQEMQPMQVEIQLQLEAFLEFLEDESNIQMVESAISRINSETEIDW